MFPRWRPRWITLALTVALTVALSGCGAGSATPTAAATPTANATATAKSPAQSEAAACSKVLTPWTQYIADSNDFAGWVATVGAKSPIVQLPQNAARIYVAEQAKAGVKTASADGFAELDRECATFAASDPGFSFHAVPTAPALPGN